MNDHSIIKGEIGLWSAVLRQAIIDFRRASKNSDPRIIEHANDYQYSARVWFGKTTDDGPGSFIWICKLLQLDPDEIREKIGFTESSRLAYLAQGRV